jgi:hypothetical protein
MKITRSLLAAVGTIASINSLSFAQLDTPATLDSSRAYQAELLADAASRTSLLADSGGPGYNSGKFSISDGGNNTLNIGGYIQTRYLMNFRDGQPSHENFTNGFQMRRTRLIFSGTVWDKHLSYLIQPEFSRSTGAFILQDAWAKYTWDNGFYARAGQYKLPLLREELVSDTFLLAVDRSAVNATFTQNRSQGAGVGYAQNDWRVMADISDGLNTLNTDFTDPTEADFAITGRGEWKFAGDDFKRFDDMTSWKGNSYAGMLGAAAHYQTGGNTGFTIDRDVLEATVDCSVEGNGWNAFVEGVWRQTKVPGTTTNDYGVVVQGGYFITDQIEAFGRYDVIIPDVGSNFNSFTVGANYYIAPHSHAFKLTGDIVYYADSTTGTPILSGTNTGINLLPETDAGEVAVRLQLQVLF